MSMSRDTAPEVPKEDKSDLVRSNSLFALDLYQELRSSRGNLGFSPLSLSISLAVAYAGARGDTESQMAKALRYGLPQDRLHPAFNRLSLDLVEGSRQRFPQHEFPTLKIANGVWCDRASTLLSGHLDMVARYYGAAIQLADFARTIIDQQGAEHLLGRGDMLFLPTGSSRLTRLHSGFITENELNRIVAFLKKQAKPVYDESVLKDPDEERPSWEGGGERDSMFVEAVRLVLQEGQCSITLIQRRMRLGYARAARIVDMMEQEGIIGLADGSKPRDVLVGPEVLATLGAPR